MKNKHLPFTLFAFFAIGILIARHDRFSSSSLFVYFAVLFIAAKLIYRSLERR